MVSSWAPPWHIAWTAVLFLMTCSWLTDRCQSTHFRGAHFWWSPNANGDPNKILLEFRIAWRRDYSERTECNSASINSGALLGPEDAGYIMCVENCDYRIGNMDFKCTDYSIVEGWTSGLRTHQVNFTSPGYYRISWKGRSWLEEVTRGPNVDWEFIIDVDTRPRSDTGAVNSSPKSAIGTILRIQEGCNQTLFIPVSDPDGDRVVCRWARGIECGGICGPPFGFMLYTTKCKLEFQQNAAPGLYALALQIEDFMLSDITLSNPLSSVPLQFLVQVYAADSNSNAVTEEPIQLNCDQQPVFIEPTPEDGVCYSIRVGIRHTVKLIARTKDEFTFIREINTVSSIGMTKSDIARYESLSTDFFVDVTWMPDRDQLGDSIFCFVAVDTSGISSNQRCIYISTFLSSPHAVIASYRREQHSIVIDFDQQIQMPTESQNIDLYSANNDDRIVSLDTSNSDIASYTNTSLIVLLPMDVALTGQYYLLIEEGAVRGYQRCGPMSLPVLNRTQILFTVEEVSTAPLTPITDTLTTDIDDRNESTMAVTTDADTLITEPATEATTKTIPTQPTVNPPTNAPSRDGDEKNYMWLIILVVVAVVLIILIIIIAIIVRWKVTHDKSGEYARQERQEEYLRNLQYQTKIVGYDGPYAPNFHDIEVKFR